MGTKQFEEKDVFIVDSPLQLLSAIEAAQHFKSRHVCAIVRYVEPSKRKQNRLHMDGVLNLYEFNRVIRVYNGSNRQFNKLRTWPVYLWLRINRRSIRNLAIGDWRSKWMQRCAKAARKESVYLLDDGMVVVNILENKIEKNLHWRAHQNGPKLLTQLKKNLFFYLLGKIEKENPKYHLFTAFFNEDDSRAVQITRNRYKFIRDKIEYSNTDGIYYFGQKLSEAGVLPLSVELQFLEQVFNKLSALYSTGQFHQKNVIIYSPHRDDSTLKIDAVKEIGFEVKRLGLPAELYFLTVNKKPKVIAGAYTTAIVNVSAIYEPEAVHIFKLPIEQIADEKKEEVIAVYNYFEKRDYQIIEEL